MRSGFTCVAVSLLILVGAISGGVRASDFSFMAGLGYDFLSQEYFLDTVVSSSDSTLTNWALTTDYLDDLKGQFGLTYSPFTDRHLEIRAAYDQTPQFLRIRLSGDMNSKIQKAKLRFNGDFESKNRYEGSSEFGDSYILGNVRTRVSLPVRESLNLSLQLKGDGVRFDSTSIYNYDYFRLGGKVGLEKTLDNFSFYSLSFGMETRKVPDTSQLNYEKLSAEASLFGFYNSGEMDIITRLERKTYQQELASGDYYRYEIDARNKYHFGISWFSKQELDFEMMRYKLSDPVNYSYLMVGMTIMAGFEKNDISFAVGPSIGYLDEQEGGQAAGEDYFESGICSRLNIIEPGSLLFSVESISGKRDLKAENDFRSDFSFERISLISDFTIVSSLRFSLIFSAEWEWHDEKEDNSRILLLSSNLTYTL